MPSCRKIQSFVQTGCEYRSCLNRRTLSAIRQLLPRPPGCLSRRNFPSWSLIGTADHVIPPAEQLFMSQRAHARITEINAGHLSLISRPGAVTRVIIAAAQATG